MRILITGANGFIGRHLVSYFHLKPNTDVIGLTRSGREFDGPPIRLAETDYIHDLESTIESIVPDVIVHCAGAADPTRSLTDPEGDFATNTVLIHRLFSAIGRSKLRPKLINLSSAAIYGNPEKLPILETHTERPLSPYGVHKMMGEQACRHLGRLHGIPNTNLRIFSAYGPALEKQVVWSLMNRMITQQDITVYGTGNETRDFIYAEDVCRAVDVIIRNAPCEGEVFNVANGIEVSIKDLATQLGEIIGFGGQITFDGQVEPGKPLNWLADITQLRNSGYSPSWSLNEGLEATAKWFLTKYKR